MDNNITFKLQWPFTMICCGPTMSGKTSFILELISNRKKIITQDIDRIVYVYTEYQEVFRKLQDDSVIFTNDSDSVDQLVEGKNCLIIYDDKMLDLSGKENKSIVEWFIKKAHHRNCSVIVLLQNAFAENFRTCSINCMYMVLFDQPRDRSVIVNIGKQFCPGKPKFLVEAYERATAKPFGYLFFDFSPSANKKFRVRSSLYPSEDCELYVPV